MNPLEIPRYRRRLGTLLLILNVVGALGLLTVTNGREVSRNDAPVPTSTLPAVDVGQIVDGATTCTVTTSDMIYCRNF